VLDDFGRLGRPWCETDSTDRKSVVVNQHDDRDQYLRASSPRRELSSALHRRMSDLGMALPPKSLPA
jgi:hypothetical protein